MVLTQPYTAEEVSLQSYALIRRYTEWKSERKEEIPVMVGKLKILPLQRTAEWEHKRIPVVKREFDFLYLLATTPGRVYTYSQIYQLVWQEYPHGDITNIIYCSPSVTPCFLCFPTAGSSSPTQNTTTS